MKTRWTDVVKMSNEELKDEIIRQQAEWDALSIIFKPSIAFLTTNLVDSINRKTLERVYIVFLSGFRILQNKYSK